MILIATGPSESQRYSGVHILTGRDSDQNPVSFHARMQVSVWLQGRFRVLGYLSVSSVPATAGAG